jgi:N-acylglucosamine 2-epimerase
MTASDSATSTDRTRHLADFYRSTLVDDILPFWLKHGLDREHHGILTCLDRDGSLLDSDKGMWQQGRFTWVMGHLYNQVEARPEWLEAAQSGVTFLRTHGFDPSDGRMWFHVTREGRPLRKRRYSFSEAFAAMGMAEVAAATQDEEMATEARQLFDRFVEHNLHPPSAPKFTDTRPLKSIGFPMIGIGLAQVFEATVGHPEATARIDRFIAQIRDEFVSKEYEAVLETVGMEGPDPDHMDGRLLNPGHAIEGAWFILEESRRRGNDPELTALGCTMLDWMWARGWDTEYGGILYFRDLLDKPVSEYWQDMKFWWPQNETVIATLLAWRLTGDTKYARWHQQIHDWAFTHFPDPDYGEWYGYLHRDGRISTPLKGNLFKGPFHLPRMLIQGMRIAESFDSSDPVK